MGWILWTHNPEGQSDDRLNNTTGYNTAINQLSPDLLMAWEWKSHFGTARVLGSVCVGAPVCPCYTFTISAILWSIPHVIARGQSLMEGADWWDACLQHRRPLETYKACLLCVFEPMKFDFSCWRQDGSVFLQLHTCLLLVFILTE